MDNELSIVVVRLSCAIVAGGLIGLERSYHGRPAGFRTHTLVCAASSLLMLLAVFQWELVAGRPLDTIRVDPTRMAQGIMTGIGFLGAGVIIKEALTIRGLTTAASIWITASIGVVIGVGLYFAAFFATIATLGTLILFRRIEAWLPSMQYAQLVVRFERHNHMKEPQLRSVITAHQIACSKLSYHLDKEGKIFQYQMTIQSNNAENFKRLSETLTEMGSVLEFSVMPTGD